MAEPETVHRITMPALGPVAAEIAATAALGRNEAVQALKRIRAREFESIHRHLVEHINETTGLDTVLTISALTDAVVRALVERAMARAGAPADWRSQAGIFAIGGYGRGEMNPHSDLDLLMLTLKPGVGWAEKAWAELNTLLWDAKFQVGASHRSVPELERILEDDFVTGTAVIEGRPVDAGEPVQAAMSALLAGFRKRRGHAFLAYKLEELAKRRQDAGASLFVMEPNLKSNPGCLRDVQLLRNMAFLACGSRNLLALGELDGIQRGDLTGVLAAHDHLLELRSLLHFTHGRKQDVFQLADQVKVAKMLGYADVSRLRAVEHFMKRHYAQVRHVHQILELAASRLEAKGYLGLRIKPLIALRSTLCEGFSVIAGRVYLADQGFWRSPRAGARLIEMCREAQRRRARLSVELARAIAANIHVVDDAARADPAAACAFLGILGDLGWSKPILSDMHSAGLLGAWLPEFGLVDLLMQFDSWHQYTVDEHTIIAMGNLDALAAGSAPGLPRMGQVFARVARRDLLALGLLLHDVGKYMGRGHVARGAMMVERVARRLALPRQDEDLVHFLVQQHVALSDASRKRDFREPAFLQPFAERIGNQERLDYLYCLTWADAKAVGEGVLTGWQEALLGELYDAVSDRLAGRSAAPDGLRTAQLAALVAAGAVATEAERHLDELGGTYEHQIPPEEVVRHWRVLQAATRDGIGLLHELRDRHVHLTLALPDRHALFADVAATLSGHGFDIVDLRTWVTPRGQVVYTMRLSSIYPGRMNESALWARLVADLQAVSAGTLDARTLLAKRRSTVRASKAADSGFEDHAIKVDGQTSERWSVVDIVTRDDVGLLSRLCGAISGFGCEIGYACINTLGDVAVDVFYITRGGRKLDESASEDLRAHIAAELGLAIRP
jgi:[protein-PII] uridylyltransferase